MAIRYGIPISEFLGRHTSAELTELMAFFWMQSEGPQPKDLPPEAQSQLIKQALFKGKGGA